MLRAKQNVDVEQDCLALGGILFSVPFRQFIMIMRGVLLLPPTPSSR
jgi:hypothetical protein